MRFAPFVAIAAAIGILSAAVPVEAQTYQSSQYKTVKRYKITINKRSYLDAGTTVKPGSQHYHDYAFGPAMRAPSYGPAGAENTYGASRWPLLRWWEY